MEEHQVKTISYRKLLNMEGKQLAKKLQELMCAIWREVKMSADWETGIICPIFKKGDKLDCNNCRGITLLDIVYKVFSNVLNERLKKITENLLVEYQCGFRKNRSTSDQIFTIRQNGKTLNITRTCIYYSWTSNKHLTA
jgi:sorting nexin-29